MDGWKNQLSSLSSGLNVNVTTLNDARLKLTQQVKSTAQSIASEVRLRVFGAASVDGGLRAGHLGSLGPDAVGWSSLGLDVECGMRDTRGENRSLRGCVVRPSLDRVLLSPSEMPAGEAKMA